METLTTGLVRTTEGCDGDIREEIHWKDGEDDRKRLGTIGEEAMTAGSPRVSPSPRASNNDERWRMNGVRIWFWSKFVCLFWNELEKI